MGLAGDSQGTYHKGLIIVSLIFAAGFVSGYKFHEWRLQWLKRRRERLAQKLRDTQNEIDLLSKH